MLFSLPLSLSLSLSLFLSSSAPLSFHSLSLSVPLSFTDYSLCTVHYSMLPSLTLFLLLSLSFLQSLFPPCLPSFLFSLPPSPLLHFLVPLSITCFSSRSFYTLSLYACTLLWGAIPLQVLVGRSSGSSVYRAGPLFWPFCLLVSQHDAGTGPTFICSLCSSIPSTIK